MCILQLKNYTETEVLQAVELSFWRCQPILDLSVSLEGLLYHKAIVVGEQCLCYVCTCHCRKQHLRTLQRLPANKIMVSIGGYLKVSCLSLPSSKLSCCWASCDTAELRWSTPDAMAGSSAPFCSVGWKLSCTSSLSLSPPSVSDAGSKWARSSSRRKQFKISLSFLDKSIFRGIAVCSLLLWVGELQLKKWTVGMMCFIAVLSRRVAKPNSSAIAYQ